MKRSVSNQNRIRKSNKSKRKKDKDTEENLNYFEDFNGISRYLDQKEEGCRHSLQTARNQCPEIQDKYALPSRG